MGRKLYCEGLRNPVGIDKSMPTLSWETEQEERIQRFWQVRLYDSGSLIFDSKSREGQARCITIPVKLKEHCSYTWVLNYELSDGMKGEQTASFSTGMFSQDLWTASYITGGSLLRKEFFVSEKVVSATLFFTGLGYCEAYLNGEKLTDAVLFPSYTVYEKTVEYTAADVTEKLLSGENAVGLMLGGHWPLDENLRAKEVYSEAFYRGRLVGICQLHITYEDGRTEIIVTDSNWKVHQSPIVQSSIFDGEIYHAGLEQEGWCQPGYDDSHWKPAILAKEPLGKLSYSYVHPIRVLEEVRPVQIWRKGNRWMLDFGKNMTGWVKIKMKEKAETKVTIRHAELLYEDGTLNVENLRFAKATDMYICKEGKQVYEPRFTYHGFRYVQVEGITGELTEEMVCAKRVHTDNHETASFSSSNELLNQIYEAMCQTMRSNMHSIPTDCCQRDERQGWMADAGVSSEFGVLNFDLRNFYQKWFRDIRDTQTEDGALPLAGAPGWPRETFIWKIGYHMCLRNIYLYTGDRQLVKENYSALQRYEEYLHAQLVNGLLSYDFYNDWLAIEFANNLMIANAFLADFYNAMVLFAEVMEDLNGKRCYEERLKELKEAINREFYGTCMDNSVGTGYYGTCDTLAVAPSAMALEFGIVPEEKRAKVIREMLFQIKESRGSVQYPTGILTSGILNQCLSDLGEDEAIYEFFCRKEYPSLGFMIEKGATTIWERWQYLVHNEMNSHNHPALCSLGTWFFKALGGLRTIRPEKEGGAVIELAPFIPNDMKWVKTEIDTVWGKISLSWEKKQEGVWYQVELPGMITAYMKQDGKSKILNGGKHQILL